MIRVNLIRLFKNENQSLGIFYFVNGKELWVCKSLELPDKSNKSNVSNIPIGEYICRWTYSPTFKREMYEVLNVPLRAGIRIHSANYHYQLRGCIALGSALKDINNDGSQDVIHSGNTMQEFEKIMNKQDFCLVISENTTTWQIA